MRHYKFITTRTPLRISFAGGGTDFLNYFSNYGGQVLSSSINKYVYVTVKKHEYGLNPEKYRLNYYSSEHVNHVDDIKNNIIRSVLKFLNYNDPLFISTVADVPAYSGLGSSSAFAVGLIKAIRELKGKTVSNLQLAEEACYIEIDLLKNPIGMQDQYATAVGDLNNIIFNKNKNIQIKPLNLTKDKMNFIFKHLMFFSTKIFRSANQVLDQQNKNNMQKINIHYLNQIKEYASEASNLFTKDFDPQKFGVLLDNTWQIKKKLSDTISNQKIDSIYQKAIKCGAAGGKISGAGGGGFLMLGVLPELKEKIRQGLIDFPEAEVSFDTKGSITVYKE